MRSIEEDTRKTQSNLVQTAVCVTNWAVYNIVQCTGDESEVALLAG